MLSSKGRSSPSFIIAVTVLIVGVIGYGAWSYLRPNPYVASEHLVRDFARTMSRDVRQYRRKLRALSEKKPSPQQLPDVLAKIDQLATDSTNEIDDRMEELRERMEDFDIKLNTQRNRIDRLRSRATEAKEMVANLAAEAKEKLRGK